MVKCSPAIQGRVARWVSSICSKGSVAATDAAMTALWRCSTGVRIHWMKAGPPARFSVVCCQSIQRSASNRWRRSCG